MNKCSSFSSLHQDISEIYSTQYFRRWPVGLSLSHLNEQFIHSQTINWFFLSLSHFLNSYILYILGYLFFIAKWVWTQGFALVKQMLYFLRNTSSPFCFSYFRDRISWNISLGWPGTMILLVSASLIAMILGVCHKHPSQDH
jgi:hypothetical protein